MLSIDILSDPVCPWCYIGKGQLDRARAARPDVALALRWRPFELNPDMPRAGADRRAYLEAKYGADGVARSQERLETLAAALGLPLAFDRVLRVPKTRDAHRLIHLAGHAGRQEAVVDALFRAYFTQGADLADPQVLAAIATAAGVDPAPLAGDGGADAVEAALAQARMMRVTAVPTYVVAGRYVLSGAQDARTWADVFDECSAADLSEKGVR